MSYWQTVYSKQSILDFIMTEQLIGMAKLFTKMSGFDATLVDEEVNPDAI
ncbi:hypothetical protein LFAB_16655 [Lactiplantibacillus fabifermentans T30PCM01]|uniref:Uncharacterized protein n=1 Tax=Lactiplantibacillus fabifermentans T30PCM01 TaxID=1400520 RepID=W6T4G7_9LACO|nr:hypothetical protein LFAB_16655 [Lactiplantibacillus fabifermentans T30PCM01]